MASEYRKLFQASLDALYAKEIQDIYTSYMDSSLNQNEKCNQLKAELPRFANKLDVLKIASTPLAIVILNVMNGLSSSTRENLDIEVIQTIRKITTQLYNSFKHSIMADDLVNKEELISEEEDLERILYLCFETCFNIAHDGIKFRKSREIFNLGVTLLARILGSLNKNGKTELLVKYEARYDQLENSIMDSGVEVEKLKECVKLLKKRSMSAQKIEQAVIEKELHELKFNFY